MSLWLCIPFHVSAPLCACTRHALCACEPVYMAGIEGFNQGVFLEIDCRNSGRRHLSYLQLDAHLALLATTISEPQLPLEKEIPRSPYPTPIPTYPTPAPLPAHTAFAFGSLSASLMFFFASYREALAADAGRHRCEAPALHARSMELATMTASQESSQAESTTNARLCAMQHVCATCVCNRV